MLRTIQPGSNLTDQPAPEEVCMQTDQSNSEAVERQSPLVEAWEAEEPPLL
jgi:hypothetical protein